MRAKHVVLGVTFVALAVLAGACGGSSSSTTTPTQPGFYIVISGMSYSPLNLDVPPGGTVSVINRDQMPHSVTSEATEGSFQAGGVAGVSFDTGVFQSATPMTFAIPAGAAEGTVVPYFCLNHRGTMVTPNATITIRAAAQPALPPGSATMGGGGTGGY